MKRISLALMILLVFIGSAFAQADLQVLSVVKLNKSESITVKQLKTRVEMYQKQMGRELAVSEKKDVLKTLVEEKLVLQAAQKAGITSPDSTVDQYFVQTLCQQIGINVQTEKELDDAIRQNTNSSLDDFLQKQTGMKIVDYKTQIKNTLTIQQYVMSLRQKEIQGIAASDDEIRSFYESNKSQFVWNDMMKMFIVLVPKGNDANAAKLKANDLRNKYIDKKLTKEQILIQAEDKNSGYQAGETIAANTQQIANSLGMDYQLLRSLFTQPDGFASDIFETATDYRFIHVGKKYSAKLLAIGDIIQPETTVTVYDYIRSNLTQQKQTQYLNTAAQEISNSLNTPENVEAKKTGDALDKLLDWGTK